MTSPILLASPIADKQTAATTGLRIVNWRLCNRSLSKPNGNCKTDDENIQSPPSKPACAKLKPKRSTSRGCTVGRVDEKQSTTKCVPSKSRNASAAVRTPPAGFASRAGVSGLEARTAVRLEVAARRCVVTVGSLRCAPECAHPSPLPRTGRALRRPLPAMHR